MLGIQSLVIELINGDEAQAERAAMALAEAGAQALPALRELLADERSEARWWAVRALAALQVEEAAALLVAALEDMDDEVRWCAALALRERPEIKAVPELVRLLKSGEPLAGRLAGDALVVRGEEAVPALLEVMQKSPQAARLEAVRALALIVDTRAIPALYSALDETSALMEYWASEGLERMGVGMVYFKST